MKVEIKNNKSHIIISDSNNNNNNNSITININNKESTEW